MDVESDDDEIDVKIDQEAINLRGVLNDTNNYAEDLAVRDELDRLIYTSLTLKTKRTIAVSYQNKLLIIPYYQTITSVLASRFWKYPKVYKQQPLDGLRMFNKSLRDVERVNCRVKSSNALAAGVVAVFAVRYKKHVTGDCSRNRGYQGFRKTPQASAYADYQYIDFCVFILKNGAIVDYAIHGYASNISEAIRRHKATKVYYNAVRDDPLDIFMNYKHQPFYEATYDKLSPTLIAPLDNDTYNPVGLCERADKHCAYCKGLIQIRGLLFENKSQTQNYYSVGSRR